MGKSNRTRIVAVLGASLALGTLSGIRSAQTLADPLPPANPVPIVYCPPERIAAGPPSPYHRLNVFLPPGPVPRRGWPVVIATGYGGGASVPTVSSLSAGDASKPLHDLVAEGIAVVHFGTPGIGNGRGLWYPPGHPSGRYESFLPRDDNAEKSAEWVVQWTKVQTLYPFDLERIGLRGSSGGAALEIRAAMGPDRARATGSAHVRTSTRVAAILAIQPPTSAWALEQGPELTLSFPGHLEQRDAPGVPATALEEVDESLQKAYSLMREVFESAEARANAEHQALCIVYADPVLRIDGAVAPFTLDASGFPILHDAIRPPLQHDGWFGYVFWKRLTELSPASAAFHAEHSLFAMRDLHALPPPLDLHDVTFAGPVHGAAAARIGHDWLVTRLGRRPTVAPRVSPSALDGEPWTLALVDGEPRPGALLRFAIEGPGGPGTRAFLRIARAPGPMPSSAWDAGARRAEIELSVPQDESFTGLELEVRALVREIVPKGGWNGRARWRTTAPLVLDFPD